jgi:hypothetical protein
VFHYVSGFGVVAILIGKIHCAWPAPHSIASRSCTFPTSIKILLNPKTEWEHDWTRQFLQVLHFSFDIKEVGEEVQIRPDWTSLTKGLWDIESLCLK